MANEDLEGKLKIDPQLEEKRITDFIQKSLKELNRDGALVGLSGGLDSSTTAYLLAKALGSKKVLGVILPDRDSAKINMEHARLVAKNLGIRCVEVDISQVLESIGVYRIGPEELKSEKDLEDLHRREALAMKLIGEHLAFKRQAGFYGIEKLPLFFMLLKGGVAAGNAFAYTKVRARMVYLYYHAWLNNYAVAGTLDKSEWSIGLFDPHGDGACDMAILRHLYKTQIKQLAMSIGVPEEIIKKPSSGDIYGNVSWEYAMGMTYDQLDQVLYGLEHGYRRDQLTNILPEKAIESIESGLKVANFIRSLPFHIEG